MTDAARIVELAARGRDISLVSATEDHRSQLRMAQRLALAEAERLRHVAGLGWFVFGGQRWKLDDSDEVTRRGIETLRRARSELGNYVSSDANDLLADIIRCESASGMQGMLRFAGALAPIAVSVRDLDSDPYAFNTRSGTLDLRTGQLRAHSPRDLITKLAGADFDVAADCARFDQFLREVLPNPAVRAYVQLVFGHAMVGKVFEHLLPILIGPGANGKTTLLEIIREAFGDYAIAAEPDLLVDAGARHPTGQADLLSVRLATCAEIDPGRQLAAATVKRLTGGDTIRARRMRGDFFEFTPSHSVVMHINRMPRVDASDYALWRRLRLVPFDQVIANPDPRLRDRLSAELPGVLRWVVEGCLRWRADGRLVAPPEVEATTLAARAEGDVLARFLRDCCVLDPGVRVNSTALFAAYVQWCEKLGLSPGSQQGFGKSLPQRGFEKTKSHGTWWYLGIGLRVDVTD